MQESTTDQRGRSHPSRCTISREDRQIMRMTVIDRSVSSRTVAEHIESNTSFIVCTYHSIPFQSGLSARHPLLCIPLTLNHRRLHRQWCDERRIWVAEWNEVVFTDESRICLSTMVGLESGDTVGKDKARPHVARFVQSYFVNHQIELLPWPASSMDLSPVENMWSMFAQRLSQITPPAAVPDQLWQRLEAAWSAILQELIHSLLNQCCGVW
ncbi:transposable element Tcb1 transposase [Trichonephila clavipes]|nr:transposable element Tcb1 transposase [Trichonephila clavipes]